MVTPDINYSPASDVPVEQINTGGTKHDYSVVNSIIENICLHYSGNRRSVLLTITPRDSFLRRPLCFLPHPFAQRIRPGGLKRLVATVAQLARTLKTLSITTRSQLTSHLPRKRMRRVARIRTRQASALLVWVILDVVVNAMVIRMFHLCGLRKTCTIQGRIMAEKLLLCRLSLCYLRRPTITTLLFQLFRWTSRQS